MNFIRIAAVAAAVTVSGCTTVEAPFIQPASFSYAHVWGGQPPEPYYSRAVAMRAAGTNEILRWPMWKIEMLCGVNRDPSGWFQSACSFQGASTGRWIIAIAEEITDPAALRVIEIHEYGHIAGWPADHPGGGKPAGHLDNCLRDMRASGMSLTTMRALCYLDGGAPLATADERARWEAMN